LRYQRKATAVLEEAATIHAVAGFRTLELLSRGRFLYQARLEGCTQVDLDADVQRYGAHRFYFRQGMHIPSFHFVLRLQD
jgi:uncharacterized pyridoxal phosphate-containing UPF0001 family protein